MPRSYLKYAPRGCTGLVSANEGNPVVLSNGLVCTPALENVHLFDSETFAIIGYLPGGSDEGGVTCLSKSADSSQLLIGYGDGHVSVYLTSDWSPIMDRALGHKLTSKVLSIAQTTDTTLVASGATDTDIVLWDISSQDPICRLRGHKSAILNLHFLEQTGKRLVSLAGDGQVKVWDVEIHACVHTFIGATSQATCFSIDIAESRMVVGGRDNILKVYNLEHNDTENVEDMFEPHGSLERQNHRPCANIKYNNSHTLLAVQSTDRVIEFYSVLGEKGVAAKMSRKKKRKREKAKDEQDVERTATSEYQRLEDVVLRADSKIRSFDFFPSKESEGSSAPDRLIVAYNDNQFDEWKITFVDKNNIQLTKSKKCDIIGHRGEIRSSSLSSNNKTLATCSTAAVKVWSIELETSGEEGSIRDCTHTFPVSEPSSLTFLPGDEHLVAGTKDGTIEICSLPRSAVIETIEAHTGEIQALTLRGDKRGIATGGKDKIVKIWSLDLTDDDETGGKRITLAQQSTLEFTDAITSIVYSPDSKFLAVALQDNTVKIYFADTYKFFLSLYGHKYPVTAISISDDSRIIATASIDKNVKLWGLDFGDCHKSIFAHDDYVTDIRFVGGTHYFWTTGKDGLLKCWDADHFSHIQTLRGHHGAIWGCELSREGGVVISYGSDRTIRSWVRTEQILFPEEEAEKEAQELADKENAASAAHAALDKADLEVGVAGQRTAIHLKHTEDLLDAIDVASAEIDRKAEGDHKGVAHPLLGSLSPLEYLGKALSGIKNHELRYVLSGLPADYSKRLLAFCVDLIREKSCRLETVSRVSFFLIRHFATELAANSELSALAMTLHGILSDSLTKQVNNHGFNNAALAVVHRVLDSNGGANDIFDTTKIVGHRKRRAP